ncbi:MAG: response regulator [Treponema sp.]|jgi:signal transduction histidine kinase/ActR/RegA family two-component response regulator|nr:response regulator [Treponema sp.]
MGKLSIPAFAETEQPDKPDPSLKVSYVVLGILAAVLAGIVFLVLLRPQTLKPGPIRINLRDYPLYVKKGFDRGTINRNPALSSWDAVLNAGEGKPALVRDLIAQERRRPFLSPDGGRAEEFTFLIAFNMDAARLDLINGNPPIFPGLFLAAIGDNWEIYLNGQPAASQVFLDDAGRIVKHRAQRSVVLHLNSEVFREGENYLGIRIIGSPSYSSTGFFYVSPYYIDDYRIASVQSFDQGTLICSTVYVFVGLYYLLLFYMRRKVRYNLYYSLFSIMVGIYFLCRNPIIYGIIDNSDATSRLEFIALYGLSFLLGAFLEELSNNRLPLALKGYGLFCAVLSLVSCIFSIEFAEDALAVWQIGGMTFFFCLVVHAVIISFIRQVLALKRVMFRDQKNPVLRATVYNLLQTPQGNIVIILFILTVTSVYDSISSVLFHTGLVYTRYSFFIFNVFSALVLARHLASSYNQAKELNTVLEATVAERTKALAEQVTIAESASRAKSEFMATMSHEIRTPLNAIIGLSDIELQKNLEADTFQAIKKIRGSGSILLGIVNDILDISKIEAGSFEIIPVEYHTAVLLSEAVRLNVIRIGNKPITFELEVDKGLPRKFIGDELRIKQILNNLLSNAIKYTREGKVRLEVYREEENVLVLRVSDTGIGIRQKDLDRLFTEYSQLDTRANRKIEGTGLGLAITRMLLELMDGTIAVESEYGKGSVFTARVPQQVADPTPLGRDWSEKLKAHEYFDAGEETRIVPVSIAGGIRVLVVDDVEINLDVARGLLEPYGLIVDTVLSGKEAIENIRRGEPRYGLILMDHMMPGMDGIEAVRIIRHEIDSDYARNVPIVALTANALAGNEEMFLKNGFTDYISKPIDIRLLDEILKKWVGNRGLFE